MFIKTKVIVKLFKAKDSNKCLYQKKKKVLVKHFKHKDYIEIRLLKKSLLGNFLKLKIPSKCVY